MFTKLILTIVLLFSSVISYADTIFDNPDNPVIHLNHVYVDSTITSIHMSSDHFNSNNFGLGVTYQPNQFFEVRAGYYKNSYSKTSKYLLGNLIPYPLVTKNNNWNINAGFAFGVVSGYTDTGGQHGLTIGNWQAAVAPNFSVEYNPWHIKTTLVFLGNAVALQGSYQIR